MQLIFPSLHKVLTQLCVMADCASAAFISATASATVLILGIAILPCFARFWPEKREKTPSVVVDKRRFFYGSSGGI